MCVHTKTLSSGYFQDNEGVCEIDSILNMSAELVFFMVIKKGLTPAAHQ